MLGKDIPSEPPGPCSFWYFSGAYANIGGSFGGAEGGQKISAMMLGKGKGSYLGRHCQITRISQWDMGDVSPAQIGKFRTRGPLRGLALGHWRQQHAEVDFFENGKSKPVAWLEWRLRYGRLEFY